MISVSRSIWKNFIPAPTSAASKCWQSKIIIQICCVISLFFRQMVSLCVGMLKIESRVDFQIPTPLIGWNLIREYPQKESCFENISMRFINAVSLWFNKIKIIMYTEKIGWKQMMDRWKKLSHDYHHQYLVSVRMY